jgi:hypothetical protein
MTIVLLKVDSFFSDLLLRSSPVESTSSPLRRVPDGNGGLVAAALQRQQYKAMNAGHEAGVGGPCIGAEDVDELDLGRRGRARPRPRAQRPGAPPQPPAVAGTARARWSSRGRWSSFGGRGLRRLDPYGHRMSVPSIGVRCQVLLPMDAVHDLLVAIQLN